MCEELMQAGRNKRLQALLRASKTLRPHRKHAKQVVRIRNKLGNIPQSADAEVVRSLTIRLSPRKSTFQERRPTATSPAKKAQPRPVTLHSRLCRRTYIKYLDDISSDDSLPADPNSPDPLMPADPQAISPSTRKNTSPQYRTPSVESSNRPASIYSLGPRRALFNLDYLESPLEDRYEVEQELLSPKESPKLQIKPVLPPTDMSRFGMGVSEDLYLFRKAPPRKLPTRKLRKLSGLKRFSMDMSYSLREEAGAVSSFLYPTSEVEIATFRTQLMKPLQARKTRMQFQPFRKSLPSHSNISPASYGTLRVTTVLPSPQVISDL